MSKLQLYESMKDLARRKRQEYNVTLDNIGLQKVREICKSEGLKITIRRGNFEKLRAAYFSDELGNEVMLNGKLPSDQRLFSLLHELKHHLVDRQSLKEILFCRKYGDQAETEIAAEVFAAEFIWPESEFVSMMNAFGITHLNSSPEMIVAFKRHSNMPVSYKFITKRLIRYSIIDEDAIKGIKFQKLETEIYGLPLWRVRKN